MASLEHSEELEVLESLEGASGLRANGPLLVFLFGVVLMA